MERTNILNSAPDANPRTNTQIKTLVFWWSGVTLLYLWSGLEVAVEKDGLVECKTVGNLF